MHGLVLYPDLTIIYQMLIFMAAYFVLSSLVFKPYLELLEARHARTDGLKQKAAEHAEQAIGFKEKYEAYVKTEKVQIAQWTETQRKQISSEEMEILGESRKQVAVQLDEIRSKTKQELLAAQNELFPLAPEIAASVSTKLLGKEIEIRVGKTSSDLQSGETISH